jgi:hypothetical protein
MMNCAIHDVLNTICRHDKDHSFTEMTTLRDACPTQFRDNPEHMHIRQGCTTRWLSPGKFLTGIVRQSENLRTQIDSAAAPQIFRK